MELDNARVRLLAGPSAAKSANAYLAGVEIHLAEDWKTYWRMPGDAGVPPHFDWAGLHQRGKPQGSLSRALAAARARCRDRRLQVSVLFPVEVVPKDASRPVGLALTMAFGICREICIPAEAKFSLTLPPRQVPGDPSPALLAAVEKVPRPQTSRRAEDPR